MDTRFAGREAAVSGRLKDSQPRRRNRPGGMVPGRQLHLQYSLSGTLERIDPLTGKRTKLLDLPPGFQPSSPIAGSRISVSADGKTLAVSTQAGNSDIWILDGFEPPPSFGERWWPR